MAIDTVSRSRRAVLMGAVGAVAASVGSALGRPSAVLAGSDGDVVLGAVNNGGATTGIHITINDPAFEATSLSASGVAIQATANGFGLIATAVGEGVHGLGTGTTGIGVFGQATSGTGLHGESDQIGAWGQSTHNDPTPDFTVVSHHTGVIGLAGTEGDIEPNTDEAGVYGFCNLSPVSTGVWGDSAQGFGVFGSGDVGVGGNGFLGLYGLGNGSGATAILGHAKPGQTGIYGYVGPSPAPVPSHDVAVYARAETTSEVALIAIGKVKFSRSGKTSMATGTSTKTITMAGVTTSSYIIATLQTNRSGIYVRAVVAANGSFKIYLNATVPGTTYVGYLVIN